MCDSASSTKKSNDWPCPLCSKVFRLRRHYDKHLEGHNNNDCRLCKTLLTTKKEHIHHMAKVHEICVKENNYKCAYCDEHFDKKLVLFNHYKKKHANGLAVCMRCGAMLKTTQDEKLHEEKHEKERPWKCKCCKESFSRRQQYLVHLKGHEKYECDECGFRCSTKLQLVKHNRNVHKYHCMAEVFICNKCDKGFSRPSSLKKHFHDHSDEKPFYCGDCSKNFRSNKGFKRHMQSWRHTSNSTVDDKKYKCDKCRPARMFFRKDNLIKHLRRPHSYECDLCDYISNTKENFKRHHSLHTEERQFICEQCGLAFFNLTTLQDHFKYVHSEVRDFQCSQCSHTFKTNSALTRHSQSHSDNRPHACHCGQTYKRMSHLRRHQDSVHGPTPRPRKLQRLVRNEAGELVPVIEEKKTKKVKQTNHIPTTTESWSNTANPVLSVMVNDSGQMVTIQQINLPDVVSLAPHCSDSYENDIMNSIQVSYNLDFTTTSSLSSVTTTEPQIVFATLDPPQQNIQLLNNILESNESLKHSEHIFMRDDMDANLSSVLLDSNTTIPLDTSCLMDTHQMINGNGEIMFSCHDTSTMISTQLPEYPSDDATSYLDQM